MEDAMRAEDSSFLHCITAFPSREGDAWAAEFKFDDRVDVKRLGHQSEVELQFQLGRGICERPDAD